MGILLVVITIIFLNNANSYGLVSQPGPNLPHGIGFAPQGNRSPEQFFHDGGKSFVFIAPDTLTTNATIGSTIQVPLTLTHKTGANPLAKVTVHYVGIKNHVLPSSAPHLTPREVADALEKTGKIPGELDLNSAVKPSVREISLDAGQSTKVILNISIPQDWPKSLVNGTIPMDVEFLDSGNHDPKDFVTNEALVMIRIVG